MIDWKKCTGCGACENICPVSCIKLENGKNGFLYPKVNEEKCIHCNKCEEVCPIQNNRNMPYEMKRVYLFINKDSYDRNISASGGFVKALADYVLEEKKGVCFGAAFAEDFSIHHIEVKNKKEVYAILGSKYVQSSVDKTFQKAKEYLEKGIYVLYTGTPCQIAGLMNYLENKQYDNLITVDIFCHGVPSQHLWKRYLKEYFPNQEIRYIQFREKTIGWWQVQFRIQFAHNDYTSFYRPPADDFIRLFLEDISINSSCFHCLYRRKKRYSDFSIGDAWNINKITQNMDDNRGITSVIVNSKKAEEIINTIENKHHVFEISMEEGAYSREELFTDKTPSRQWEEFMKNYPDGIKKTIKDLNI